LRILLTNDDGLLADGINAAHRALTGAGHKVLACAPDRERSASSHSVTMRTPLKVTPTTMLTGAIGYAVSGTPADSARLGIELFNDPPFDLVVSGVNNDTNLGFDTNYSGTVAGALEACGNSIAAIAVSVEKKSPFHWDKVGSVLTDVVSKLSLWNLPIGTALNVNIPHTILNKEYVWVVTQQKAAPDHLDIVKFPDGSMEVTRHRDSFPDLLEDFTDVDYIQRGYVTLTPIIPVSTNLEVLLRLTDRGNTRLS
jgi:5'-nucleotidase